MPRFFDTGVDDVINIDKIKTHLRYAQLRSLNSSMTWGVKFDTASSSYWLFNINPPTNDEDVSITFPGEEAAQVPFNTTATPPLIAFDDLGRPYTDATLQNAFTTENLDFGTGETIIITNNTGYIP